MKRFLPLCAAVLLAACPAEAHLMAPGWGTLNVVETSVFAALSMSTSALHGVDDNQDGVVDLAEFERHEASIKAEIDRRLAIFDGSTLAATVNLDLVLSPRHDAPSHQADQIIALKHARFAEPPRSLRIRCDLFGADAPEREGGGPPTCRPGQTMCCGDGFCGGPETPANCPADCK